MLVAVHMDELCEEWQLRHRLLHSLSVDHPNYAGECRRRFISLDHRWLDFFILANLLHGGRWLNADLLAALRDRHSRFDAILGLHVHHLPSLLHGLVVSGVLWDQDYNARVAAAMADPDGHHHHLPSALGNLAALWILHLCELCWNACNLSRVLMICFSSAAYPNVLLHGQLAVDGVQREY